MVFKPLTKDRFKHLFGDREIDLTVKKRTFIKPDDWKNIVRILPPEIEPFVMLAYNYDARRGEVLGFKPSDVKKGHLSIERSIAGLRPEPQYKATKGKLKRTVPHWYCEARAAHEWIKKVQSLLFDPDTLTQIWKGVMEVVGCTYDFHDLRHSFITRAIREHNHRDVQLAAGHKHIKTTMGYAHDDRTTDNEEFEPDEAA